MSTPTILLIPVRSYHVKQYLHRKYGTQQVPLGSGIKLNAAVLVNRNNLLGKMVLMSTAKLPYRIDRPKATPAPYMVELQLPKALKHRTMTEDQRELLGEALDKFFIAELYTFIEAQAAITGSEWAAIRCFRDFYQLDSESFDVDSVFKNWRDYKNAITEENKLAIQQWYQSHKIAPTEAA